MINYFEAILSEERSENRQLRCRTPRLMIADLTNRCNLRCAYCCFFSHPEESQAAEISPEVWNKLWDEAEALGVMEVRLRGGEALIRSDFSQILADLVKHKLRFRLQTNGTFLTREIVKQIADSGRCNLISISLDGQEQTHDQARGKGAFAGAMRGIELVRETNLPLRVVAALHKKNYRQMDESLNYLAGTLALKEVGFSQVTECSNQDDWALGIPEEVEAMSTLQRNFLKYRGQLAAEGMSNLLLIWHRMQLRLEKLLAPGPEAFCVCNLPFSMLAVRADGVFVPCMDMANVEVGKLGVDDIQTLWTDSPEMNAIRNRRTSAKDWENCRVCPYADFCGGGCPAKLPQNAKQPTEFCLARVLEAGFQLDPEIRNWLLKDGGQK